MTAEQKFFIKKTMRKVGKALFQYELIGEGDNIIVALSGGKDSYIMLEVLADRKKYLPIDFSLHAVHVNIEEVPYETDRQTLEDFCGERKIPFHYRSVSIEWEDDPKLNRCFLCSWNRRKELFKACEDLTCNKVALGHHRDDMVETFIMNMIFQGSLSTMPPKLSMFNGQVEIIRPLALLGEEKLIEFARIMEYPIQKKECPYGDDTKRNAVKNIIDEMEKLNKYARNSIFKAMSNPHAEYLFPEPKKKQG